MAFEKDVLEIKEIQDDVENLMKRLQDFSYEIETEDVEKSLKQVKTLYNTCGRIFNHLASLTTIDDMKNFMDNKLEIEKKKIRFDFALEKIRKALHYNNMIDSVTLNIHRIVKEDVDLICEHFNISCKQGNHGFWSWIVFEQDGKVLSSDDLIKIGLLLPRPIEEKVEKMEKEEEKPEVMPYGWLAPDATFTKGDFGDHEKAALDIINEKGFKPEYKEWRKEHSNMLGRDFLTTVKGYVLLHNPYLGGLGATIPSYDKKPTKKQCEFLYDYFSREKDMQQANFFLEMIG